jgi:hypothetical protein
MKLPSLAPEASASTSSATLAIKAAVSVQPSAFSKTLMKAELLTLQIIKFNQKNTLMQVILKGFC